MIALDTKSNHILDAALPVFVRHGFRKASMADIARAANISRASLYLSFGSKEGLFRAGSTRAHASTMRNVEAALAGSGDVFVRIESAIAAFHRGLIAPFASSPDAVELFEVNMALAKDITLAARATLVERLAQALADAQAPGVVALDRLNAKPGEIANVIVAAMEGIKHAPGDGEKLEAGMQLFMRLLRAAIS
jgi:AcrR family transcriptional regulator